MLTCYTDLFLVCLVPKVSFWELLWQHCLQTGYTSSHPTISIRSRSTNRTICSLTVLYTEE